MVGPTLNVILLNLKEKIMTNRNTLTLRALDIPSIHKFGLGFDNMFGELHRLTSQQQTNYPPHNVIQTGDETITIEIAVAGFDEGEIDIKVEDRVLAINGSTELTAEPENYEYLHRGLSRRNFTQSFTLAPHVEVINASNKNGILTIMLERKLPEEKKPKQIAITYTK